jgi:hypothetical protein
MANSEHSLRQISKIIIFDTKLFDQIGHKVHVTKRKIDLPVFGAISMVSSQPASGDCAIRPQKCDHVINFLRFSDE